MVSNRWSRTRFKTPKYEALVSRWEPKGTRRFFKRLLFSRKLNKQRALRAEQGPDAAGTTNQLDRYREELRAFVTRDEPQCPTPKTNSTSSKETSLRS